MGNQLNYKIMKKFFIGIDVSKETIDVSFFEPDRMRSPEYLAQYQNAPKGFRSMVKDLRLCSYGISCGQWVFCCETTGIFDHALCNWIVDHGMVIWRESALQIKWSSGVQRGKNDEVDSLRITEYAWRYQDKIQPYVKPSASLSSLKALFSHRKRLIEKRTAAYCQISSLSKSKESFSSVCKLIIKDLKREIDRLSNSIRDMEKAIKETIQSDDELTRNYNHIISIKGVGPITATALIVYSGNFKVITSAKKMACYSGVASFKNQSGTSINKKADVTNLANRHIKVLLGMAARSASKTNPVFVEYFEHLTARGKPKALTYNNLKNKILVIAYKLIQDDSDFDENYKLEHSNGKQKQTINEARMRTGL